MVKRKGLRVKHIGWFALFFCACLSAPSNAATLKPQAVLILISIDGLHPDYLGRAKTPSIDKIAAAGVTADWMEAVFPSFTFPVHYSLVTGLHPAQHGIVANRMRDPTTDRIFSPSNNNEVTSSDWWGGEPIWVTAERQNLTAATLFWPGSEAEIAGYRPSYFRTYQVNLPHRERVQQVLTWLDQPKPPQLITLYFSQVDNTGHTFGPQSSQVITALEEVDSHIGDLLDGLAQRNRLDNAHIVLVSDHGMAEISEQRTVYLDDYLDLNRLQPSLLGPVAFLWPEAQAINDIQQQLNAAHPKMRVYKPEELPTRFNFTGHRRIPPLVALAKDGWLINYRSPNRPYADALGAHGYDPAYPSMHAIFIARSPHIKPGSRIDPISALDVYPLMAHLLKITPAKNEGRLHVFESVLKQ